MRLPLLILLMACFVLSFQQLIHADDSDDPIRARLDDAKAIHAKALDQAAGDLRQSFDDAIQSATAANDGDQVAELEAQKDTFSSSGAMPIAPAMSAAAASYQDAVRLADANLERAYDRAVRHYAAEGKDDLAMAVVHEKNSVLKVHPDGEGAPAALADAIDPQTIAQNLAAAKAAYRSSVTQSRGTLLARIQARLNEAMDAGDLPTVQVLQAAQGAVQSGGEVPDTITDPAIVRAAADFKQAVQSANIRMARAYTLAVRDYTRARQIDQAEAIQAEFVASGLSTIDLTALPADAGGTVQDTTYLLGWHLPDFLTTGDPWDWHGRGIFLQRHAFIRTRLGDYLDRDFTCDFWFTTESTGTYIFIGIGNGRGRPDDGVPINSLALNINSPDNQSGTVGFLRADGQLDPIGQLPTAGDYVARIQKLGTILTLAVGDEDADGTFNPRFATTVSDTTVLAPFMTAHSAHLFFGGGRFWKLRFINGRPPTVVPDMVVKSVMAG